MIRTIAAAVAAFAFGLTAAQAETEVVIQYPYPDLFNKTHEQIAAAFAEAHPDIRITFRGPYKDYEDATQRVLREAVAGDLPDITFQGLNRVRVFADKGIAQPLNERIAAEKDFESEGFHEAMFAAGTIDDTVYGVPFAISLPVAYYNLDLVRQAGGDPQHLPETWDELIALATRIDALGDDIHGVTPEWSITGNWFWQSLVFANGGTMMNDDETKVAFDGEAGQQAIDVLARMVRQAHAPNLSGTDMRTAFAAGKVGILLTSTAYLNTLGQQVGGKFELITRQFPGIEPGGSRLPAGGNVAIITAKDPARQAAAWEALKFWTGAAGGAVVVQTTGYMAPNKNAAQQLQEFYEKNPNQHTAVEQLPYLTSWYAFPGPNGLKITDTVKDHLQSVMDGTRVDQADAVLAEMAADVQALIPASE